jgi:hypothetical protein
VIDRLSVINAVCVSFLVVLFIQTHMSQHVCLPGPSVPWARYWSYWSWLDKLVTVEEVLITPWWAPFHFLDLHPLHALQYSFKVYGRNVVFNPQSTIYSFDSGVLSHSHIHVHSLKFIRRLTPSTSEFEGYVLTPNNSILSNLSVSLMPVSQLTDSASLPPSALLLLMLLARQTLVIHVSTTIRLYLVQRYLTIFKVNP